ncbi:hypothetical protein N9L19_00505 [bacterium]|nr:hypothetical protein [bacterium]
MAEGPTSDGGQDAQDPAGDTPSPKTVSSASDDGPTPTRRDMNRIKSRLVRMAEHLRTTVSDNKVESNQALEQEVQTRREERVADLELQALLAPALMRLLDERIGALGTGVRALVDKLRIDIADSIQEMQEAQALLQDQMREMEANLLTMNESAQVAIDIATNRDNAPRSEWSDWSLVDDDAFQQLVARVEVLELSGSTLSSDHEGCQDSGWHEEDARLLMEQVHHLTQRVEELESISLDPTRGAGAGLSPRKNKPVSMRRRLSLASALSLTTRRPFASGTRRWSTPWRVCARSMARPLRG